MKLVDLPPEILQAIAEDTLIALGPFKAQRLRLVNKFWSHHVLQAMFTTRIIDSLPCYRFGGMTTSMKARHLETRTLTDSHGINGLTTVIQRAVLLLVKGKETGQQSDDLRRKYTRLLCAATVDRLDSEILRTLKSTFISNHQVNEDVRDTFAAAAHVGDVSLLRNFIHKDIDIDAESHYFGRPLRGAAFGGHRDAVLLLLDHGADVNAESTSVPVDDWPQIGFRDRRTTALQAAALKGHEHIIRLLLEPKYHVHALGKEYEQAILYATRGGHLCLVRFLMDKAKYLPSKRLPQWILLDACSYGHEPIVRMMLDLGANLNDPYRWDNKRLRLVQGVVKNPLRDAKSCNPLRAAVSANFYKIVQLLLARGADPNHAGEYEHNTPLYDAVRGGHERVAQMLLDHGADINGGRFDNPLHLAVSRRDPRMVHFLLERGAALDTQTEASKGKSNGKANLEAAAIMGHEPIVRLLLKFGVSVEECEEEPNWAMQSAMMNGYDDVVKTLIEFGAKTEPLLVETIFEDYED